ncbi:sperm microtubule inner protein 8-like [Watersipora subatra]|uniref:sperm microtubule inner protein 8-like n=1 Tax=Watersipora subatra TaxID=2589382 RepID=UPI00355B92E4
MSLAMQGTGATPGYAIDYSSRSLRLASVKNGIFNPRLPKIRQMDRDTNMHRLPDEHCRTSTTLGENDFLRANSSVFRPGAIKLHHLPITAQGRALLKYGPDQRTERSKTSLDRQREQWQEDVVRTPSKFTVEMRESQPSSGPTFTGYAVRYLRPEITSSWQYTLQQKPRLDQHGQRPVPANIFARYRDTHPQYSVDAAVEGWR